MGRVMPVLHAVRALWRWVFWTLCVRAGGPRHHSYGYARLEQWQARESLKRYLRGEEA
jgi:hypothetical protein